MQIDATSGNNTYSFQQTPNPCVNMVSNVDSHLEGSVTLIAALARYAKRWRSVEGSIPQDVQCFQNWRYSSVEHIKIHLSQIKLQRRQFFNKAMLHQPQAKE